MTDSRSRLLIPRRTLCAATLSLGASTLTSSWTSSAAAAGVWKEIDDDEGIKVFKQEVPGSSIFAFRGVTVINAPIEKVLWVVADNKHRKDWVDRLKQSTVLEQRGPFEFVVYQHFGAPAIVSDRDFVFEAKAYMRKDGAARLDIKSVTHPKAPKTAGVRGHLKHSSYTLKPKGRMTEVDVTVHMDPRGSIPNWLVNMIQKSWPKNTLTGLSKQVKKSFVGNFPLPPVR